MTAALPGTAQTAPRPTAADDGEPASGRCVSLRTSLVEQGYVPARFGGIPVFVGPGLAAQLRAPREKQS